jgi:hypothetical protein
MNKVFEALAILLPIKTEQVSWGGDTLMLSSKNWIFRTESVWRVSKNHRLQFTCWDGDASTLVSNFLGVSVVEVNWLIGTQPIDPAIRLSDGCVLEVFCSSSIDPWVMEFSGGVVYLGNS